MALERFRRKLWALTDVCWRIDGPNGLEHFWGPMMVSLRGALFPKEVILLAVFFCFRCAVSYRKLENILEGRGMPNHTGMHRRLLILQ